MDFTTLFNLALGPGLVLGLGSLIASKLMRDANGAGVAARREDAFPMTGRWLRYGLSAFVMALALAAAAGLASIVLPRF